MGVYRSNIVVLSIKIGPIGGRILPQVINIAGFADFLSYRQCSHINLYAFDETFMSNGHACCPFGLPHVFSVS